MARTYAAQLNEDPEWALTQGSLHFQGGSDVHKALQRITRRLNELGVSYAVAGGMALFHHGYRRFTEDVDILVRKEGLKTIHDNLRGLGYLPPFRRSKNLRDTQLNVKIEFLREGDYPGDGKPKPVAFPDPDEVFVESPSGVRYVNLPTLVTLKLASGLTGGADRLKDLADVSELIKALRLDRSYACGLDPFVQEKFQELWQGVHAARRYVRTWPGRADSLEALIDQEEGEGAEALRAMLRDGVWLDPEGSAEGRVLLVASDPAVAERHGMEDESELWDEELGDA